MLTQVKSARLPIPEDKILTLEVHPNIRSKIQVTPRAQFYRRPRPFRQTNFSPLLQAPQFSLSSKPQQTSQILPRSRHRPVQLSSYQLYKQEQKQHRQRPRDKSQDWRIKRSSSTSREHNRMTKSLSSGQPRTLQKTIELLENNRLKATIDHHISYKGRSIYVWTHSGRRRTIDNSHFLQNLSQRLEHSPVRSFSRVLGTLIPDVVSISPQSRREEPETKKTSRKFERSGGKTAESRKKGTFQGENLACRPWSGNKGDLQLGSDFSSFFAN